jgi:hypothetical protein
MSSLSTMSEQRIDVITYLEMRRDQGASVDALTTQVADLLVQHPDWDLTQPRTPAQWAELITA